MTSEPAELQDRGASTTGWLVASLLLGGAALRVALGFESFWFDEAWSHGLSRQADRALEIFQIRHDNNHLLNTLYLYAVRDLVGSSHWILYRVPSLLAGCLSLLVLWRLAARWTRREGLLVLALTATSFPLALASAQARGYALAILCSLAYAALAQRPVGKRDGRVALGLAAIAIAGLLAHVTFVYTWLAVVAWRALRDEPRSLLLRHAAPLACLGALYFGFYAGLEVGGGPSYERFVTIRQAITQTMSLPRRGSATWLATGLALLLIGRGLILLTRRRDPRAAFFAVALALAPGIVITLADPRLLYARYLLVIFPWFYWIVAIVLADELERGPTRRALAIGAFAFFLASNLWHAGNVLAEGRNDYLRTLAYMDANTSGPRLEIGGDHDFRHATLLRFHENHVPSRRPVVYLKPSQWPEPGPEWYLRHDWKAGQNPEKRITIGPGRWYALVAAFEHGPGDGFQWFVYRRVKLPASPGAASSRR